MTVASPFESFISRPALWPISSQNQLAKGSKGSPCPFGISVFELKNSSHARSARTDRSVTWSSSTIFIFINTSSQEVFKTAWKQPRSPLGEGIQRHSWRYGLYFSCIISSISTKYVQRARRMFEHDAMKQLKIEVEKW